MSTATSRMTIGALFGAIATAANTASNTLNAVNDGVEMLNRTISVAAQKQKIDHKLDLIEYERTVTIQAAQRIQEHDDQIEDWIASRPGRAQSFQKTLEEVQTALANADKRNAA